MAKTKDAKVILEALGLPRDQQNEISCYTLLALCNVGPRNSWANAGRQGMTISRGVMAFIEHKYRKQYAPNTRETFRRQVLHQFCQAFIADLNPDAPDLPTNSPRTHYAINLSALKAIQAYGTKGFGDAAKVFRNQRGALAEVYRKRREATLIPVTMPNGDCVTLSPGKHNEVQAAIIQQFGGRFAPGSKLIYLGDTSQKDLFVDKAGLKELGISMNRHDKLPDVVLYDGKRNRLFLIEAVTSHGPMTPKRLHELEQMLTKVKADKIYVSAFPDFAEFKRHLDDISWETEVWIVEIPDHMIHYNGDKFLGSASSRS